MTDPTKPLRTITILPPKMEPGVYADTSVTVQSKYDVTILFMRAPFITPELVAELDKNSTNTAIGQIVASVAMPLAVAKELGKALLALNERGSE